MNGGDGIAADEDAVAIDIDDLSFMYPVAELPVLRDAGWKVPVGAFALLVGGTGSGKSTLLSLLKPEIAPAGAKQGSIRVLGRELDDFTPAESARDIGYVFQNPDNQLVCESVWHEMAFGLESLGTPQAEMRRLVAETSYFFGMESWFREDVDALSGGRKQLLALASTLVMQPRLLLLDEPTAQLDPIAEKNFLHALFRANRELGCTVVVATHRPQAMVDYATCAFRLVDGALLRVLDLDRLRGRESLLAPRTPRGKSLSLSGKMDDFPGNALETAASGADAGQYARKSCLEQPKTGASEPKADKFGAQARPVQRISGKSSQKSRRGVQNAPDTAIELRRAWFRYGRDAPWVLRNLELAVPAGRIHALVGGNGCGKSTLLSIMAGTQRLQQGRFICDEDSRALLPQDPRALFAEETVADELMEWSRVGGYGPNAADDMLDELGLSGCSSLHPYDLSGGQQQLLALGKLLLVHPRILLLDEPTKGLDVPARRVIARLLAGLADDGMSVVMATHDLDLVSQLADDVSMVFDGEIACTCPREEFFRGNVYYRP